MSRARTALAAVLAMLFSVAPGIAQGAPKAPREAKVSAPRKEGARREQKPSAPAAGKTRAKSQSLGARLAAEDEKATARRAEHGPGRSSPARADVGADTKKAGPDTKRVGQDRKQGGQDGKPSAKTAEPEAPKARTDTRPAEPEKRKADARKTDARKTDAKKTDARNTDARNTDARNTDARNTDARNTDAKKKTKPRRPIRAVPANASWKPYRRPPWRRGHVTLFGHGKKWSGYLLNEDNEVPEAAHRSVSRVLASWRTGRQVLIDERLIRLIADVSDEFGGRPIRIVSGYRERSYAHDSKHKTGEAFDFSVPGVPNEALRDFLRSLGRVGVGYYPNSTHVHLDVREKPTYWVDYSFPGAKPMYASDKRIARWSPAERAIGAALDAMDTRATLKALSTPSATAAAVADAAGRRGAERASARAPAATVEPKRAPEARAVDATALPSADAGAARVVTATAPETGREAAARDAGLPSRAAAGDAGAASTSRASQGGDAGGAAPAALSE
jgi:hypothetical protein